MPRTRLHADCAVGVSEVRALPLGFAVANKQVIRLIKSQ